MKKSYTDLFSTIVFSIRNSKLTFFSILLSLMPISPVLANNGSVEILNYRTDGDLVILKVRVLDSDNQPVSGLKLNNFQISTVNEQGVSANPAVVKVVSPENSKPDPANIIILLDMSGSMQQRDATKIRKLEGAVRAIRELLQQLREKDLPYQIAIVPFGFSDSSENCSVTFKVNEEEIKQKFRSLKDTNLDNQLNDLANRDVCAATNLYQPVGEAVKFLGLQGGSIVTSTNKGNSIEANPNTRLAVILLSDGYHVVDRDKPDRPNEEQQFAKLRKVLQSNSTKVTVHTLGYGDSLRKLRDRTKCPLKDSQLDTPQAVDMVRKNCKIPELKADQFIEEAMLLISRTDAQYSPPTNDINTFIVDERRLKDIARATGGLNDFPQSSKDVVISLIRFFATLREYEVIYKQTGAKPATAYKTIVVATSKERNLEFSSPETSIRLSNIIFSQLPLEIRLYILLITIVGIGGTWIILFWLWSDRLRNNKN
jgi:hypothetical protein